MIRRLRLINKQGHDLINITFGDSYESHSFPVDVHIVNDHITKVILEPDVEGNEMYQDEVVEVEVVEVKESWFKRMILFRWMR